MAVAQKIGATRYLECSAKSGQGVREVFEHATRAALLSKPGKRSKENVPFFKLEETFYLQRFQESSFHVFICGEVVRRERVGMGRERGGTKSQIGNEKALGGFQRNSWRARNG